MPRGLAWLLAHSEAQEVTGTQFCHYAPRRPLIREAGTPGQASRTGSGVETKRWRTSSVAPRLQESPQESILLF